MTHITLQGIIDGNAGAASRLAIPRRQCSRLLDSTARYVATTRLDNHVRTRDAARVQPHIVRRRLVESNILVLAAVLANQDGKTFAALRVNWHAATRWHRFAFSRLAALTFPFMQRL